MSPAPVVLEELLSRDSSTVTRRVYEGPGVHLVVLRLDPYRSKAMEKSYWQERWDTKQIGFHLGRPHPALERHAGVFTDKHRVLVPLAGKSFDLDHLASLGLEVTANEFVERASRAWFEERNLVPTERRDGSQLLLQHERVTFWVDDFFALAAREERFDAVFDRAALVAIKPEDRPRYVQVLRTLMAPGAVMLLVVFEYDSSKFEGPPFALDGAEVRGLFAEGFAVNELDASDEPAGERFQQVGIHSLREQVYRIERT